MEVEKHNEADENELLISSLRIWSNFPRYHLNEPKRLTDLCLPHKPELEDVDVAAALDGLVTRIIGDVILFILLEQVACTHGVTACQDSLHTQHTHTVSHITRSQSLQMVLEESPPLYLLSDQDGRALQGNAHHLVRVPRHRVGPAKKKTKKKPRRHHKHSHLFQPTSSASDSPLDAAQLMAVLPGHQESAAPRSLRRE